MISHVTQFRSGRSILERLPQNEGRRQTPCLAFYPFEWPAQLAAQLVRAQLAAQLAPRIVSPAALEVNCHMRRPQHFHFYLFVHLVLCVKPDKPRRNLQFRATFIRPCVNRFRTLLTRATAGSGGDQSIQDSVFDRRIPAAAR